jgi:WhiB family transcriptional regulator, redox-sensing transcriptional regulator
MPQQPRAQVPDDVQWNWQEQGACRRADPTMFFHPQNERGSSRVQRELRAKRVCAVCTVRLECADYALRAREPYGVWGGLSEEERELVYARLDSRAYPRERGSGLRNGGDVIEAAVSPRALGIA